MKNNQELNNSLIKRKNLIKLFNSKGIKRIGFGSLNLIEDKIEEDVLKLCSMLKEEMEVNGKKVLEKSDVENVINNLKKGEEVDY